MPDDDAGFLSSVRSYATEYVQARRRALNAKPQTQVEGAGTDTSVTFSGQDISQSDMKDVKQMRESGGIVSQAFHSKALVKFGTEVQLQAENDELEEWMHDNVGHLNDTILDLGEDAMWYPYALGEIVETQTGNFSHIELVEPWTMLPVTDEYGDILYWEQHLDGNYGQAQRFEPEEIGSIVLNKSSGRDNTGISEALRSEQEIETFRSNQQAMREATQRIGYPFVHAKAGREGATQLNDTELRRIRNRLADIGPGETQVTGPDVDIDLKDPATVDFGKIQERDMRMLATSLGIPVELLNEGSDGLGSGMPAELRKDLLRLQNEADRRRFSDQFVEQFVRPIVRDYSPFDHTMHLTLEFEPFMDEQADMASLIQTVGDYMTVNEVRERLGLTQIEEEDVGDAYSTPAEAVAEEQQAGEEAQAGGEAMDPTDDDGDGQGFLASSGLHLETPEGVPNDANGPVDDSEVPEGATTFEGPGGGTYYKTVGGDGDGDDGGSGSGSGTPQATEIDPPDDSGSLLGGIMDDFESIEDDISDQPDDTSVMSAEEQAELHKERIDELPTDLASEKSPDDTSGHEVSQFYGDTGGNTDGLFPAAAVVDDGGPFLGLGADMKPTDELPDDTPFRAETDIPVYDSLGKVAAIDTAMDTGDFSNIQSRIHEVYNGTSRNEHFGGAEPDRVEEYKEAMENGEEFPMPYIVMDGEGQVTNNQEGRHRALAAMAAGIEDIPVRIIIDTDADGLEASPLNRDREQSSRGLQDIEDINTTPSQGAADAARMALDWKEETGNPNDCGTQTGWTRASQLADRESLTEETINRMVSFFARHESTQEPDEPKEDCSRMMWKAWGGDAGRSWAEDTQAQFDTAREASASHPVRADGSHDCGAIALSDLSTDKWLGWEHDLFELQHGIAHGDTDLTLNQIVDSGMPSFVKDRIRDAIMSDALFSDFDAIDSNQIMQMRLFFEEQLEQDGWTTDMVAGRLQDLEPELTRSEAERIARTESQALINDAREEGYEQTGMLEGEKFYWVGSLDDRTTDACKWLIGGSSAADNIGGAFDGTNPNEGGNPVSLEELKELVQKAAKKDPAINTKAREFTPHINCRKTYVRDV